MTPVPLPYRLVARREDTGDTVTLVLEPAGGGLEPFAPGQFAMLYAFGVGEIPVSVSGIVDGPRLTHTVRAVGAVSRALCGLRVGASVGVRGPFGTPWDLATARGRDVLVIAGGIGLAPLRPLVHAVLAEPRAYGRLNVLAGARSPEDLLYRDEFPDWRRPFAVATVDRPSVGWAGRVGVVTTLLDEARFAPGDTTAFVCGPEVMIRATARALLGRGVPPGRVRVSLERNMRCATGHCGHCQLGPLLLCRDGPVVGYDEAEPLLAVREL
ncbi:FAD/NAD(P)-binding protein [Streptomyces sp. JJ38]|uniref:FAD/NAD(P)-binding protein n=1 Tax=Streptomyces sp. JJ38 TaxID=2738128 RepID=UPI001C580594|nr:FAD/NAD(P)-binding protein [Streptomyces sp. JJ38]MBW1596431.1 FAD/NAD(P)-binding protein [Streptomyces sp. JJ38]